VSGEESSWLGEEKVKVRPLENVEPCSNLRVGEYLESSRKMACVEGRSQSREEWATWREY
jgi:hypothetical protein